MERKKERRKEGSGDRERKKNKVWSAEAAAMKAASRAPVSELRQPFFLSVPLADACRDTDKPREVKFCW